MGPVQPEARSASRASRSLPGLSALDLNAAAEPPIFGANLYSLYVLLKMGGSTGLELRKCSRPHQTEVAEAACEPSTATESSLPASKNLNSCTLARLRYNTVHICEYACLPTLLLRLDYTYIRMCVTLRSGLEQSSPVGPRQDTLETSHSQKHRLRVGIAGH